MVTTLAIDPSIGLQVGSDPQLHGPVIEEIRGLIRVFEDGHVERPPIVPCVPSTLDPGSGVLSRDTIIDRFTNLSARFYAPPMHHGNKISPTKLPLVVYFHGGGFCVGSAAWSCYHQFLAKLALKADIVIMSVNYRLAPENPLPAAYEDGFKALKWLKQQSVSCRAASWWAKRCDFSSVFLAGDSAGANIAQNLATRLASSNQLEATALKPLGFKGTVLIQPFFGGEARTESERNMAAAASRSPLSVAASDTYWRLALPAGANRDHPWCNPLKGRVLEGLKLAPTMVCISEKDILRDRNIEFCRALGKSGGVVDQFVYRGVGHAFQILGKGEIAEARAEDVVLDIKTFISTRSDSISFNSICN